MMVRIVARYRRRADGRWERLIMDTNGAGWVEMTAAECKAKGLL